MKVEQRREAAVDVGRMLDEGHWGGYQRFLVLLTAIAIVFDGADIQLLGIALPAIMREWAVARSVFAPILAAGLLGMMLGGAVAGMTGDRLGRRVALIGSVLVFGVMTAATSIVNGPIALAALRFLAGFGLGGAVPNAAALASEFVPRRHRSFAVTLTIVCVPVGGALAGFAAIRVLPALGWRWLFVIGGLAPIAMGLLLLRLMPESPRYLARHPARWGELASSFRRMGFVVPAGASFVDSSERVLTRASVVALFARDFRRDTLALWGAFFFCLLAVYLGFNWVPSLLNAAGMSPTAGSAGITAFNLGGVVGALGGALAFPRFGSRVTMLTMAGGAVMGALGLRLLPLAASSAVTPIILMLGVTGGLINAVQTTMYALAAQMYPTTVRATGVGAAAAIGRGGAIASTYAGAWALERGGSSSFFTLIATAMAMALISLALVRRHIPGAFTRSPGGVTRPRHSGIAAILAGPSNAPMECGCGAISDTMASGMADTTTVSRIRRYRRSTGEHPPNDSPAYRSTALRHPQQPLVVIPQTLSELTGPVYGYGRIGPWDNDLTRQHAGEPLGERIVVEGRVLDEDGRPVRETLVEVWQANAAGRYAHAEDRHDAPLDPNFSGAGRVLTDADGAFRFVTIKPGAYPWRNHDNAWRPAHVHFSVFGTSFLTRLVTQMYFPGDPLLKFDPIFNSIPGDRARERVIAAFDLGLTKPEWALGYRFDIVLRGRDATPTGL